VGGLTSAPGTGPGNIISGNIGIGLDLFADSDNNQVQGNIIGADITGTHVLGNSLGGISISGHDNMVGGTDANAHNIIAFNGTSPNTGSGIAVTDSNGSIYINNALLGNSIFANIRLGINLVVPADGPNGVTPN